MKKFEYKTVVFDKKGTFETNIELNPNDLEEKMNALGDEGWELIVSANNAQLGHTIASVFIFKREK
jgi:hypothetical protein